MKRFIQIVCVLLVFATLMPISALAAENGNSRASNYFGYSSVYFHHVSGGQYQIWFDVTAVSRMTELGTSKIVVECSTDLVDWDPVKTYNKATYSQMTTTSTTAHYANYVTYYPADGYAYRAKVTLYAKNSSGSAEMTETTTVLDLR
jgi:hypothetical protein